MKTEINNIPRFEAPPRCIESERVVLSILMNSNAMLQVLTEHRIGAEHFSSDILREIYLSCCEILDDGQNLDAAMVIDHLRQKKKFFEDAINNTIEQLYKASHLSHEILPHVQKLLEFQVRRKVYYDGYALIRKSLSSNGKFKIAHNELDTLNAKELMKMEFPEQRWIVPDVIPDGLSILSSRPKKGKSRLVLNVSVAVSTGGYAFGNIPVEKSGVLYLALDDSPRRLKKRLNLILQGEEAPDNLHIRTEYKTIKDGALDTLDGWLKQNEDVKLVIIDTYAKIRGVAKRGSDLYQFDYNEVSKIKKIADNNDISIILVHHTRKASAEDFLDTVSGTTGITGAVDSVLILQKDRGSADAVLQVTGKDVEERELALKSDTVTLSWVLLGDAIEHRMSEERKEIIKLIRESKEPIRTKDIAEALGKKPPAVSRLLTKLIKDDLISQHKNGGYVHNNNSKYGK